MVTNKVTRSHKKLDPDFKAILDVYRALKKSSDKNALEFNLAFVAEHFGYGIYPLVKKKNNTRVAQLAEALVSDTKG